MLPEPYPDMFGTRSDFWMKMLSRHKYSPDSRARLWVTWTYYELCRDRLLTEWELTPEAAKARELVYAGMCKFMRSIAGTPEHYELLTMAIPNTFCVQFNYTNYRGEKSIRRVVPNQVYFGSTHYHKTPQWLMNGYDVDKKAQRTFAMSDITEWKEA